MHHVVFDSLEHTNASLYLGSWDPRAGELWFDDAQLEETMFVSPRFLQVEVISRC